MLVTNILAITCIFSFILQDLTVKELLDFTELTQHSNSPYRKHPNSVTDRGPRSVFLKIIRSRCELFSRHSNCWWCWKCSRIIKHCLPFCAFKQSNVEARGSQGNDVITIIFVCRTNYFRMRCGATSVRSNFMWNMFLQEKERSQE